MFYYKTALGLKSEPYENNVIVKKPGITGAVLKQGFNDIDEYNSDDALLLGSLVHRYLERHKFGDPVNQSLFDKIFMGLDITDQNKNKDYLRKKMLKHLELTISDEKLTEMLVRGRGYAEVPFIFSTAMGCEFRGVIDRLFVDKDQNGWSVIDWKSNDLSGKDPEYIIKENGYDLQLACYRWAIESILKERVRDTYIYFTDTGKLLRSQCKNSPEKILLEMMEKIKTYDCNAEKRYDDMKTMLVSDFICQNCGFRRICENRIKTLKN